MFDFWFFRPNGRGTLLLNTWLTLIDWWTSLCKCCLASKISTPRSFPSWRITWSLCDHETTLRPLSFEWTKITKKKWSTTTPQTWRPRFKVKLKISHRPNFRSNPGFAEHRISRCLKITQNVQIWILELLAFSTKFWLITSDLSGNTVWR